MIFINSSSAICNRSYTNEMRHCILDGGVTDPEIRFKVWYGICGAHITRQDQDGFLCPVAVSFFQVGVLWSSAIFGVWTLCRPVARFYFPAVQWVPASITDFGDSRHPGWPQRGRSLTLVGIEVLVVGADLHNELWIEYFNVSMAAAFSRNVLQCHVFGFEASMWPRQGTSYHLILTKYAWAGPGI